MFVMPVYEGSGFITDSFNLCTYKYIYIYVGKYKSQLMKAIPQQRPTS